MRRSQLPSPWALLQSTLPHPGSPPALPKCFCPKSAILNLPRMLSASPRSGPCAGKPFILCCAARITLSWAGVRAMQASLLRFTNGSFPPEGYSSRAACFAGLFLWKRLAIWQYGAGPGMPGGHSVVGAAPRRVVPGPRQRSPPLASPLPVMAEHCCQHPSCKFRARLNCRLLPTDLIQHFRYHWLSVSD